MPRALVDYVIELYSTRGGEMYGGEAVTQLDHALQCAELAQAEGAPDALIAASLLHDLGHLMPQRRERAPVALDDHHELVPLRLLRAHFGDPVLGPIRLHVAAKRYLCAVDPDYRNELTPASARSLDLQGGPFLPEAVKAFITQPYARDAVRLRTWDDRAKAPGARTRAIADYFDLLMGCAYEPADTESPA